MNRMSLRCFLLSLLAAVIHFQFGRAEPLWKDVCTQADTKDLPFCDPTLPTEDRVKDLLARIPVEAQIQMMGHHAAAYDPLHIPSYQWWNEGLHGVVQYMCFNGTVVDDDNDNGNPTTTTTITRCATSFPSPSALATAWNDTLVYRVASVVGTQGRAISNVRIHDDARQHSKYYHTDGLTFWTPVVNLQRDPRWGRNQEVPGEDPLRTSRFAVQFVRGLQQVPYAQAAGNDGSILQVAACCKHWLGNSLEQWHEASRHDFDARISEADLHEYYLPPFRACVQEAAAVMCSYNAVNGIPMCVHDELTRDVLRDAWGFTGYITSDCWALRDVHERHNYTASDAETAALAINATVNLNCGDVYQQSLSTALQQGLVTVEAIAEQFRTLLTVQMKLGLYNHPKHATSSSPYGHLGIRDIDTPENQQLALEAAEQSIVLLKNSRLPLTKTTTTVTATLPLSPGQSIAVIGPHANATSALLGSYRGWRCSSGLDVDCIETPYAALRQANAKQGGTTVSALGCSVDGSDHLDIAQARAVAASADTIVLFMGLDQGQETEGLDRESTTLPGHQLEVIQAILELQNPRTVLVLFNGGAVSLGNLRDEMPAIVQAGYGGQAAASALARVLMGEYNPSGRLVATVYPPEYAQQMPLTDMGLRNGVGRTHMFYLGQSEFAFGHGLSYSDWTVQYEVSYDGRNRQWTLWATLMNQGPYEGRQSLVVLSVGSHQHLLDNSNENRKALQRLIDYDVTSKILPVHAQETLSFDVDPSSLSEDESLVVLEPNGRRKDLGSFKSLLALWREDSTTSTLRRRMIVGNKIDSGSSSSS